MTAREPAIARRAAQWLEVQGLEVYPRYIAPVRGVSLHAEPGAIRLQVGDREVWLSPHMARWWSQALRQMADTAEQLEAERD